MRTTPRCVYCDRGVVYPGDICWRCSGEEGGEIEKSRRKFMSHLMDNVDEDWMRERTERMLVYQARAEQRLPLFEEA